MIQPRSIVRITDNCGAKIGRIFKVLGSSKKRWAEIGDLVVLSVQKAEPRKTEIKKDDNVIILAGKDKGKTGKVTMAMPKEDKVIVSGINVMKKRQKPKSKV